MITGGYGVTVLATEWMNILQGMQVVMMHSAQYVGLGLAGIIIISVWQRLRFTFAGQY